ncbi:MAG TPA: hypothetical protein VLU41_06700, partial [Ideonella sp.]|nr:hypothetical protein [Ideonella sp.]
MHGIDTTDLTLIAWSLAALTLLVVVLMSVAALALRRAVGERDARLERLSRERETALRDADHAAELAQREVAAARERGETWLAGAGLGSFEWDLASGRLDTGGAFAAQLGLGAHEIAPHIDAWLRLAHPDDAARLAGLPAAAPDAAGRLVAELRLRHADGR